FFSKLVKTNCEKLVKLNLLITSISKTIHYSLLVIHYKTAGFVCIRDLEGAEGGTSWSERRDGCSEMGSIWLSEVQRSTGAIADPGKSPTAWVESWGGNAGMPL
ncbi:MAG: hypothetical protein RBS29_01905, partial [Bacteroidales bacterium]|nr:hypothetical protein [Bacteroidales bacterium]